MKVIFQNFIYDNESNKLIRKINKVTKKKEKIEKKIKHYEQKKWCWYDYIIIFMLNPIGIMITIISSLRSD